MHHIKIYISFFLLFLNCQFLVNANELGSNYIEQFATAFLTEQFPSSDEEKVLISVSSLDPRIEIKSCEVPLNANIPEKTGARNVNIKISCDDTADRKSVV